jgi:hypothetical protein
VKHIENVFLASPLLRRDKSIVPVPSQVDEWRDRSVT